MDATLRQPKNLSLLEAGAFRFTVARLPTVSYFIQEVGGMGLSFAVTKVSSPLMTIPIPGDKLNFENLNLTFMVDEDLTNYLEIVTWLFAMGHPTNSEQYKALLLSKFTQEEVRLRRSLPNTSHFMCDASLVSLTGSKNPNVIFFFHDLFPVGLTGITYRSTDTQVMYMQATVTFAYRDWVVERSAGPHVSQNSP